MKGGRGGEWDGDWGKKFLFPPFFFYQWEKFGEKGPGWKGGRRMKWNILALILCWEGGGVGCLGAFVRTKTAFVVGCSIKPQRMRICVKTQHRQQKEPCDTRIESTTASMFYKRRLITSWTVIKLLVFLAKTLYIETSEGRKTFQNHSHPDLGWILSGRTFWVCNRF